MPGLALTACSPPTRIRATSRVRRRPLSRSGPVVERPERLQTTAVWRHHLERHFRLRDPYFPSRRVHRPAAVTGPLEPGVAPTSEDPATAPAAPPAAGTARREKYGAAFCAIRPLDCCSGDGARPERVELVGMFTCEVDDLQRRPWGEPGEEEHEDARDHLGHLLGCAGTGLADALDQDAVARDEDQYQDQLGDDEGDGRLDPSTCPRDGDVRQRSGERERGEYGGDDDEDLADHEREVDDHRRDDAGE